jgi:CRP/FNR family transcriptional regulator
MAAISGSPYEVTAETLQTCQAAFLRRDDFLRFVARHPEASRGVITQLSRLYSGTCEQLRTIGLSSSVPEKLARFFLDCSADTKDIKKEMPVNLGLTHEEIAERIGTTRESVTRTLSEFKSRRLVALQGSTLMIYDRTALEAIGCQ